MVTLMAHSSSSYGSLYEGNARVSGIQPFANNSGSSKTVDSFSASVHAATSVNPSSAELLRSEYVRKPHLDVGTRFGQKLRELRHTSGMTQIDVAVMLGMDRSYISEVERGKKGISLATLEIIALGFRLPLSDLLRDL